MFERRMAGPERIVVLRVPRPVQFAIGADRGDDHPVERKQQDDDEEPQRGVEVDRAFPARAFNHQRVSTRRIYSNCNSTTTNSTGKIANEIAAPSDSSPVPTPIW